MKIRRGFLLTAMLCLLALLTCGCGKGNVGILDPQELYSLPELPAKYTELNSQLNFILERGAEYAAPASGSNIQPVQMRDLDGDGREEALAFFRNSADEKPLKIYIFTVADERYQQTALIEGSGTAVHSITYSDLDGDGLTELLVGWRVGTDLLALSVYDLCPDGPREILRSDYVRYSVLDLNDDPNRELVVLRSDEEGSGVADYYSWKDGTLGLQSSARISMTMAQLSQQGRVTGGTLRNGSPALFLTGVETGTEQPSRAIFDILTVKNEELVNVVLSDATGVSSEIARFCSLYPNDLNNDGLTEVPWPLDFEAEGGKAAGNPFIEWRTYDDRGSARTALYTYHDMEDGWYLQLPEEWKGKIHAQRTVYSDEATVTFSICSGEMEKPFLRITAITGSNRMVKAVRGTRFNLSRQPETVYVAELLEANHSWAYGWKEDEVRGAFSLIRPEWNAGDN